MLAKCPVVASRISGVPEVLENNKNGLLFSPGNTQELKTQILRILTDEKLKHIITKKAYIDANEIFNEKVVINQIEDFYKI